MTNLEISQIVAEIKVGSVIKVMSTSYEVYNVTNGVDCFHLIKLSGTGARLSSKNHKNLTTYSKTAISTGLKMNVIAVN